MNAKEFFDMVSSYYAAKENAMVEYTACKDDLERKKCHNKWKAVIDAKWSLIACEVKRVHHSRSSLALTEQQQTLETLQRNVAHIVERIRINGCELEWLKKEKDRLMKLISEKDSNHK